MAGEPGALNPCAGSKGGDAEVSRPSNEGLLRVLKLLGQHGGRHKSGCRSGAGAVHFTLCILRVCCILSIELGPGRSGWAHAWSMAGQSRDKQWRLSQAGGGRWRGSQWPVVADALGSTSSSLSLALLFAHWVPFGESLLLRPRSYLHNWDPEYETRNSICQGLICFFLTKFIHPAHKYL